MDMERRESVILLAKLEQKLENIEQQVTRLWELNEETKKTHSALGRKIDEYMSHWKAVRNIGAFFIAVVMLVKTGDASALKALFSAGP